jgi:hypothetical protein
MVMGVDIDEWFGCEDKDELLVELNKELDVMLMGNAERGTIVFFNDEKYNDRDELEKMMKGFFNGDIEYYDVG